MVCGLHFYLHSASLNKIFFKFFFISHYAFTIKFVFIFVDLSLLFIRQFYSPHHISLLKWCSCLEIIVCFSITVEPF